MKYYYSAIGCVRSKYPDTNWGFADKDYKDGDTIYKMIEMHNSDINLWLVFTDDDGYRFASLGEEIFLYTLFDEPYPERVINESGQDDKDEAQGHNQRYLDRLDAVMDKIKCA